MQETADGAGQTRWANKLGKEDWNLAVADGAELVRPGLKARRRFRLPLHPSLRYFHVCYICPALVVAAHKAVIVAAVVVVAS